MSHPTFVSTRHRSDWMNPLFFLLMVVSLFPLGISPEAQILAKVAPGVLWIAALLSTLLAVDALFLQDYEDGTLEQLVLSPSSLYLMVLAKVVTHWLVTGLPLVIMAPVLGLQFDLGADALPDDAELVGEHRAAEGGDAERYQLAVGKFLEVNAHDCLQ